MEAVFQKLPQEQSLTLDLLKKVTLLSNADTRTRQRTCVALGALAKFAGLDPSSISELRGNYGSQSTLPRELPSDE
jgi:hypothetical protein